MSLSTVLRGFLSLIVLLVTLDAVAAQRGALSPSAPVRLEYELPDTLPESGSLTLPLKLSTSLTSGRLHIEVVSSEGLFVQSAALTSFDLRDAEQPFNYDLRVVLGADAARYVIVLVSVDGQIGSQSRSFRIDLSRSVQSPSAPNDNGLKLLPSTAPP